MKLLSKLLIGLGLLAASPVVLGQVVYNKFSPGGALTGTWNSQNVNMAAGNPFIFGILPSTNGGTDNAFFSVAGPSGTTKIYTFPNASASILTTNTVVTVPQGGTGASSLTGVVHGNGTSPFTAGPVVLTSEVSGILPFANGGTGLSTALDDTTLVSSGSAWVATALPNCTDTSGQHLNYTTATNLFSCGTSAPGGITGLANPTATVGLVAVNGSATTALRSDGAPALSQAIVPTWSGLHTFSVPPLASANAPGYQLFEADAAADSRYWDLSVNASVLHGQTCNDAISVCRDWVAVSRNAASEAITNVAFGNATNNPTYSFLGTGAATFSGNVSAANVLSGIYTPTITNVANVAASTIYQSQYMRVGNVVTVSGRIDITPSVISTATQVDLSLPVASNFTIAPGTELGGAGSGTGVGGLQQTVALSASSANDRAQLFYTSVGISSVGIFYSYTYLVAP